MNLHVGAATTDITPTPGLRMAGYGARVGVATGTLVPLTARVLYMRSGERQLVVVTLDVIAVGREVTSSIRDRLLGELGCPAAAIMVTATHTHSSFSPLAESNCPPWLDGGDEPDRIARVTEAVVSAARNAAAGAEPARLTTAPFSVPGVGANRRHPEAAGGEDFRVLVAARRADDGPVAVLILGEIHPTILEADNVRYSPDYPGRVREIVERNTGAIALFLTGAAGNINPVWTEHTPQEVERVGAIIGLRATEAVLRVQRADTTHWTVNLSLGRDHAVPGDPNHRTVEPVSLDAKIELLRLIERVGPDAEAARERLRDLSARLQRTPDDVHVLASVQQARIESVMAAAGHGPRGRERTSELQVLRLSPSLAIIGLPGEFFAETRRQIAASVPGQDVIVTGYANDYLSYVPPAAAFPYAGYEVGCARFPPETEKIFVERAVAMLQAG
jgi:neutral ceramidase